MKLRAIYALVLGVALACPAFAADAPPAGVPKIDAETLAKRVGQVFAGFDDFWVWIDQRYKSADGKEAEPVKGRAYYKRDKMFRINFGQPPTRVEGTNGDEYWIYDAEKKTIEYSPLDANAPVHPLLMVFAAGDQMVRALDRYFNVDAFEETAFGTDKVPAYKLALSFKADRLKELKEKGGDKLITEGVKQITIWVNKEKSLPIQVQVDMTTKARYTFDLSADQAGVQKGEFNHDVGLDSGLFNRPTPPGVTVTEMPKH